MTNIKSAIVIAVVLIVSLVACSSSIDKKNKDVDNGTMQSEDPKVAVLPAFEMTDVNGNIINLESFKGKKVFVNLWATWCPPCRAEIPSIEKLKSKLDKEKVAFVMLSLDENFNVAKQFAKSNQLQIPIFYPATSLPAMFNTNGIPATFIFNEKGELIKVNNGVEDYDTNDYLQLLKS